MLLMCRKMRRAGRSARRAKRSLGAAYRHMTHACAGFGAKTRLDHLIIGEKRAVEEQHIGVPQARRGLRR